MTSRNRPRPPDCTDPSRGKASFRCLIPLGATATSTTVRRQERASIEMEGRGRERAPPPSSRIRRAAGRLQQQQQLKLVFCSVLFPSSLAPLAERFPRDLYRPNYPAAFSPPPSPLHPLHWPRRPFSSLSPGHLFVVLGLAPVSKSAPWKKLPRKW